MIRSLQRRTFTLHDTHFVNPAVQRAKLVFTSLARCQATAAFLDQLPKLKASPREAAARPILSQRLQIEVWRRIQGRSAVATVRVRPRHGMAACIAQHQDSMARPSLAFATRRNPRINWTSQEALSHSEPIGVRIRLENVENICPVPARQSTLAPAPGAFHGRETRVR